MNERIETIATLTANEEYEEARKALETAIEKGITEEELRSLGEITADKVKAKIQKRQDYQGRLG